jgi:GH15 family glucan-1,4-alpha-glucosidase
MYRKINDYGIIGNLQTIALIAGDGAIDWLCLPAIDSPAVFAALLDDRIGGRFRIQPEEAWDSAAAYRPRTNILVTRFRTRSGAHMELTDFMPLPADKHAPGTVYRRVKVREGEMPLRLAFEPNSTMPAANRSCSSSTTGWSPLPRPPCRRLQGRAGIRHLRKDDRRDGDR